MRICEKRQVEIISSRSAALLVWLRPVGYGGYILHFQTLDQNCCESDWTSPGTGRKILSNFFDQFLSNRLSVSF